MFERCQKDVHCSGHCNKGLYFKFFEYPAQLIKDTSNKQYYGIFIVYIHECGWISTVLWQIYHIISLIDFMPWMDGVYIAYLCQKYMYWKKSIGYVLSFKSWFWVFFVFFFWRKIPPQLFSNSCMKWLRTWNLRAVTEKPTSFIKHLGKTKQNYYTGQQCNNFNVNETKLSESNNRA